MISPDHDKLLEVSQEEKSIEEKVLSMQADIEDLKKKVTTLSNSYITFLAIWLVVSSILVYISLNHINVVRLLKFLKI